MLGRYGRATLVVRRIDAGGAAQWSDAGAVRQQVVQADAGGTGGR